jgi:hypothetical protein
MMAQVGDLRRRIGIPAQIADIVRRYEAVGVHQIIFSIQIGATSTSTSARRSSCSPAK